MEYNARGVLVTGSFGLPIREVLRRYARIATIVAMMGVFAVPASANAPVGLQPTTTVFGRDQRVAAILEAQLASLAGTSPGRVGIAAIDLDRGTMVAINGDTPFPMASASKIAIAATFLDEVDKGRFTLDQKFPLMVPLPSRPGSTAIAPVRAGQSLSARTLIDMMMIHSNNQAADAILAAAGGPRAVNAWLANAGITGQRLDHDMATLVRDDGQVDPARVVDPRTSSTPHAMIALLTALDRGTVLSPTSRAVLFGAMSRCATGARRIKGLLPAGTEVEHKTGTLNRVTVDVGFMRLPDGRRIALSVFMAGPEGHAVHTVKIAEAAKLIYDNLY